MRPIAWLRAAHAARPRCASCAHFDNAPSAVEAALPGLQSFGSADSAVRAADGVCVRTSRYLASDRWCEQHSGRPGADRPKLLE